MIFAVIGLFGASPAARPPGFEAAVNEHLAQRVPRIVNAGYLRGPQGEMVGVLALVDAADLAQAQAYLEASPFWQRGDYERVQVAAYDVEVGRLA
jgi:uncharacterized protein YciI